MEPETYQHPKQPHAEKPLAVYPTDPNPPKNAAYWKRRALKAEKELAYRVNNFENSGLWPSTIIESDQLMPDGKPKKLAVVPNWCIHKIECNARNSKPVGVDLSPTEPE
jgi:hypothetical protein